MTRTTTPLPDCEQAQTAWYLTRAQVLGAGKQIYQTCGFTQIGEGITWWLRP